MRNAQSCASSGHRARHQRSSEAISGHQRPSAVISGHQRSSEAISGHQRSSAHLGELGRALERHVDSIAHLLRHYDAPRKALLLRTLGSVRH